MARPASEYNKKRNFDITPEPPEEGAPKKKAKPHALQFVIQKHDARGLHYDLRLEIDGTLKSWAVPKGPSLDPKEKRMAIQTEDHPLAYAEFEGTIPHGEYGAGDMIVWDHGIWQPHGDATEIYKSGKLKFTLIGEKLSGDWTLVKTKGYGNGKQDSWLLIKERDEVARLSNEYNILTDRPESAISGELLPMDQSHANKTRGTSSKSKNVDPNVKETIKQTLKKTTAKALDAAVEKKSVGQKLSSEIKRKAVSIPEEFSPQLATLVSEPPQGDWLYEIKFDGYRMLARVRKGKVNLFTRNGHDWTERMSIQAKAIEALKLKDSWLDGEVVVLNENGLPSFQALQNAFDVGRSQEIIFYLFDAPYLNGFDLREVPLEERRGQLEKLLANNDGPLRYSGIFNADHQSIVQSACALSLEGVIGKRAGSPYVSRRSNDWIKLKCRLRQEFVIVGYTKPQGSRSGFGAILLGVHKDIGSKELLYAGRVGTGFNDEKLRDIYKKMVAIKRDTPPVSTKLTSEQKRGACWIEPKLICEVEFAEWTGEGVLRQATFISLRTDKPAKDIIRERPKNLVTTSSDEKSEKKSNVKKAASEKKAVVESIPRSGKVDVAGIGISHPDRVLDSESRGTKLELAKFYESISEFILPHLSNRPVSLLRAPDGIVGEQFFQKHSENLSIPHITQLDKSLDPTHGRLMQIDNVQGLIGCAQMNTIELHTWGATTGAIEAPDRFILDLDPDPALPWRSVIEATRLTLSLLDELKLQAFVKTTGGKGMHIVVPLTPDAGWEYVKAFSKAVADFMAKQIPERFVSKMGPKNRIGRLFIDYLRNARGASTVCAYSVRARPGLAVSVPITRDELEKVTNSDQWNIANLHERLEKLTRNPWGEYTGATYKKNQKITKIMWKKLGLLEPNKIRE